MLDVKPLHHKPIMKFTLSRLLFSGRFLSLKLRVNREGHREKIIMKTHLPVLVSLCFVTVFAEKSSKVVFALNVGGVRLADNSGIQYQADPTGTREKFVLLGYHLQSIDVYSSGRKMSKPMQIALTVNGTGHYRLSLFYKSNNNANTTVFFVKLNNEHVISVPAEPKLFIPQETIIEFDIRGDELLIDANRSQIIGNQVNLEFTSQQNVRNVLNGLVLTKIEPGTREYQTKIPNMFISLFLIILIDLMLTLISIIWPNGSGN
jgi:hypothetical protein